MNCPYCDYRFGVFAANGDVKTAEIIPVLCEDCTQISLIQNGKIRQIEPEELAALKTSPAWHEFLAPALEVVLKNKLIKNHSAAVN